MESKFTPGPWLFYQVECAGLPNKGNSFEVEGNSPHVEGKAQVVCSINGPWKHENYKANARLISAAPELLAALEACIERMAELQEHTNYPLAWPRVQAMQAIAKAKGEK